MKHHRENQAIANIIRRCNKLTTPHIEQIKKYTLSPIKLNPAYNCSNPYPSANISAILTAGNRSKIRGSIKRMAWECRGCGRIPNAEKLAVIRAKIFKIWAKYSAAFTCK